MSDTQSELADLSAIAGFPLLLKTEAPYGLFRELGTPLAFSLAKAPDSDTVVGQVYSEGLHPRILDPWEVFGTGAMAQAYVIAPGAASDNFPCCHRYAKPAGDYPCLYEVWSGDALVYLQTPMERDVADVLYVRLKPGERVIVPEGWAVAVYNTGATALACEWIVVPTKDIPQPVEWTRIQDWDGLAHRVLRRDDGGVSFDLNPHYRTVPLPREIEAPELSAFGLTPGEPVLTMMEKNPEAFRWLLHPEEFAEPLNALYAEDEW
ncbi:MAG: hypothetical protein OHK0029_21120 [Armatimonadaceae bacterium]